MNEPYFSILIPVYKNVEYIHDCLQSILNQDFADYEIIICCQGDSTVDDIVSDNRINNIYLEKPSLYLARIESYRKARGKYVLFIDSDDELVEGALSDLYETIEKNDGVDIIQFGYSSTKDSQDKCGLTPQKNILSKEEYLSYFLSELGTYPIWRKCFKRKGITFYDEDIFLSEDALLTLAFILQATTIVSIDKVLYYYRPNAKSGTSNLKVKYLDDLAIFIKYSFQYRRSNKEIEMGIYSFINTYMVFHYAFPTYDYLSLPNVNDVVSMLETYDFVTTPTFIKTLFLSSVKNDRNSLLYIVRTLGYRIMRKFGKRFYVHLNMN